MFFLETIFIPMDVLPVIINVYLCPYTANFQEDYKSDCLFLIGSRMIMDHGMHVYLGLGFTGIIDPFLYSVGGSSEILPWDPRT